MGSHLAIMLKHKIRKSRKNILSFLDQSQENENNQNFPEYSEIKKVSKKEKKRRDEALWTTDQDKYKSRSRSKSEARSNNRIKNVETQTSDVSTIAGGPYYYMPLFVPCPVVRRSSPEEDYMWTLSGVRSLIDQQQQLLKLFT